MTPPLEAADQVRFEVGTCLMAPTELTIEPLDPEDQSLFLRAGEQVKIMEIDDKLVTLRYQGGFPDQSGYQDVFPVEVLNLLVGDRRAGRGVGPERAEAVLKDGAAVREEPAAEVAAFMRQAHRVVESLLGGGEH